jgi:hypothetical protein
LPGTTFSNVREKGSYNSAKQATMTMSELERWLGARKVRRDGIHFHGLRYLSLVSRCTQIPK